MTIVKNMGGRSKRGTLFTVALLAAAGLALSGCADLDVGSQAPGENTGEPVVGGTIVAAMSGDPTTLDVGFNSNALTIVAATSVFEMLFAMDESYEPQPMIAKGYEVSSDRKTYTITIRDNVKFHNGEIVDSNDVVASLTRWGNISGIGKQAWAGLESIKAVDDTTVVMALKQPQFSLINDLAYNVQGAIIVPEEVAKAFPDSPIADDDTIGTGPYKLAKYTHGEKIVLDRFDDYSSLAGGVSSGFAGPKTAYADHVEFRFVSDPNQQMNGLQTGQFQWAQNIGPDNFDVAKENPALNPIVTRSGLVATLLMNFNPEAATADLRVRQALNLIIDKKAMALSAFGPEPLWTPQDGSVVLAENNAMHSSKGEKTFKAHDVEKAKKLFAEAGITQDQPIRIFTTQTYPKYYQMAVVIQAALEEIGLKADVQVFDFPTMITKLSEDPTGWDIGMTAFSGTITSPAQVLFLTQSWPGEYKNPEVENIKVAYSQAASPEEAKRQVDALQGLIWKDLPVITIAPNRTFVTTAGLKNPSEFAIGVYWNTWLDQ